MAVVTPDLPDIFEEAYERAGLELNTGYDLRTVRRSLNIMLLEWQNRGLNLFTIDEGTLNIASGTSTYTMPVDTIDVIEHQIRTGTGTNQIDTALQRISVSTYAAQSNKNTTGKPSQIYVYGYHSEYYNIPYKDNYFDFLIAFNSVYMYNLGDVIKTLIEIERVSKQSYVVLASGDSDEERNKFNNWTLIGTTILLKKEWKSIFKEINFRGDYYFSTIKSLGL